MAANRYGQIWHGDHRHINIKFPSTEARLKFQNEFEAYHASHDHEGDIPTFKNVVSKDLKLTTGSRSPQDLVKAETDEDYRITIDGIVGRRFMTTTIRMVLASTHGIASQRAAFRLLSLSITNSLILTHSSGTNFQRFSKICRIPSFYHS